MTIVIPMSGQGKRFFEAGYSVYKPFLPLGDKTVIEAVTENLAVPKALFIYILRLEHLKQMPRMKVSNLTRSIPHLTEGAACTVLEAKDQINTEEELIIANADQLVDYGITDFLDKARSYDASIMTFPSIHPKWSYAQIHDGLVTQVAEKQPISQYATVGIYYFKRGNDFVKAAERMIEDNFRVNGEFYVCPAYNWLPRHYKIGFYHIKEEEMHGLGTPEDYETYCETLR